MKIIFMGTPEFAVPVLEALICSRHEVALVVTQPDKPKGRGKAMQFPPVKECAISHNIDVIQPSRLRDEGVLEKLAEYKPDLIAVVAFGQILPKSVLELPKYGCINVHASLLPKYRGAGPIQWAVINGEAQSGVTTMFMSKGLDKGDMLLKETVDLAPDETGDTLHDKLSCIGGPLLLRTIDELESGSLKRIPQSDEESSYAPMLEKSMGDIRWDSEAVKIERLVRGLNPWPSAYTRINGKTVKLWSCEVIPYSGGIPGEIMEASKDRLIIKAKDDAILVHELQPEGKKRMSAAAYLRGNQVKEHKIAGNNF